VYESLGVIEGVGYSIGNHDFDGWYQDKNKYQNRKLKARPWILANKWESLRQKVDRSMYATITYAPAEWHMNSWVGFEWIEDDGDRSRKWEDEKPTPNYSEITAHAPFADIDLADAVKHKRPDGNIPQEQIEAALNEYIDAFAELAGSREHVFALDSVGGAYVFIAPSSTTPIAREFDADERELIFGDMMDRLNVWLGDVRDDVISAIPETEGTFAPDKLNNKNRLFKAPLSVHSSLDGVVTPVDVADPSYDYTPLSAVEGDLIDDTTRWADGFTDDHTAAISAIVTSLYPNATDEADSWKDALATVVRDLEAAQEQEPEPEPGSNPEANNGAEDTDPADVEKTENKQVVFDAIRDIDAEDLVEDQCDEWDVGNRTPPRFHPGYRGSGSGTSCFVNSEGKIVDLDDEISAFGVVTYVAREKNIIRQDDTPTGSDWWEAVDELRKLDYHIPRYVGDDDISDYYAYPIDRTARTNGYGEPFEDDIALLRTCLRLRDEHPELSDATPPYAALVAIADIFSLLMADAEEGILGDSGYRYASEIYDELTLDNLADELGD
jgi:putative DNA primase/helicase